MAAFPGGAVPEVVFSFDTTGSMSSCLEEVRGRLADLIQRLQSDLAGLRVAVFAHGDYCDRHNYVTKHHDFSTDIKSLCTFVKTVKATGGGDGEECYELVLRQAREQLSWTPGSRRALIMIGDAPPHEPDYPDNKLRIDWRQEAKLYAIMGCRIYPVQVGTWGEATKFYETLARETGGRHLRLSEFQNLLDFIMAVCYREHGDDFLQVYEKEVRARCTEGGLHGDLDGLFSTLRDGPDAVTSPTKIVEKKPKTNAKGDHSSKKVSVSTPRPDLTRGPRGRLPVKASAKKISKPFKLPLLRRERVPEANFALGHLKWSGWVRVISPTLPASQASQWRARPGDGRGFKRRLLSFGAARAGAVLYEVAVQPRQRARRAVVCSRLVVSLQPARWEKRLLGGAHVRVQVDRVVRSGCSVWVRGASLSSGQRVTSARSLLGRYDYAWSRQRKVRVGHREVISSGVKVSHNDV